MKRISKNQAEMLNGKSHYEIALWAEANNFLVIADPDNNERSIIETKSGIIAEIIGDSEAKLVIAKG